MSAPEEAFRTALTGAMATSPAVQTVLGSPLRLYADRSRDAAYPHASWGKAESREQGAAGVTLIEHRLTLDIWCRDRDAMPTTSAIREAIRGLDIVLPAPWRLVSLGPAYSDGFATRDPRVKRGLIRLRALIARS